MADFYFFTDVDRINKTQDNFSSADLAKRQLEFGPVRKSQTSGNYKHLHLGSTHFTTYDSTSRPSVYAVCNGTIVFRSIQQPIGGQLSKTNLVDIILKPRVQSENNPRIKYFIYRSVLLESIAYEDGSSGNWFFKDNDGNDFSSKWINEMAGKPVSIINETNNLKNKYDELLTDESYLDDLFIHNSLNQHTYEVHGGSEIGRFPAKGDRSLAPESSASVSFEIFGFQIILDNYGFNPKSNEILSKRGYLFNSNQIEYYERALSKSCYLDLDQYLSGLSLDSTDFIDKSGDRFLLETQKEYLLNFLDPAAFYGNFSNRSRDKLILKSKGSNFFVVHDDSSDMQLTIPKAPHSNKRLINDYLIHAEDTSDSSQTERVFLNNNSVYLDIRDQFGNSHNYFHRFGNLGSGTLEDLRIVFNTTQGFNGQATPNKHKIPSKYVNNINPISTIPLVNINKHFKSSSQNHEDIVLSESSPMYFLLEFKLHQDDITAQEVKATYDIYVDNDSRVTSISPISRKSFEPSNSKFFNLSIGDNEEYTTSLKLFLNHIYNNDDNKNYLISQYLRITVIRHLADIGLTEPLSPSSDLSSDYYAPSNTHALKIPELVNYEYLDNIWCPFDRDYYVPNNTQSRLLTVLNSRYVNNTQSDGIDFFSDIGVGIDNGSGFRTLFLSANDYRFAQYPTLSNLYESVDKHPTYNSSSIGDIHSIIREEINDGRTPLKVDILSLPNDLPNTDPGRSQIIDSSRQFSTISDVDDVRPSPRELKKFIPGFSSITFSEDQWNTLKNIYDFYFLNNGEKKLKGFKTYLGFKHDGVYKDNDDREYVRFKVVIRGFQEVVDINSNKKIVLQEFDSTTSGNMVFTRHRFPVQKASRKGYTSVFW